MVQEEGVRLLPPELHADRPLLRYLTPILRPILRWNHNWSAARAKEGLEPYPRTRAAGPTAAAE